MSNPGTPPPPPSPPPPSVRAPLGAPAPFDVCGPLPTGLTVLEASAGTGKTWSIAALVARYVADGVPVDGLLVVTFTRAATGELRDRVRERLRDTEAGLARLLGAGAAGAGGHARSPGTTTSTTDPVVALLAADGPEIAEVRRRRLADAIGDFDAATVTTTHGFCELVLSGLGTAGDVDREITFEPDTDELVEEVADDLYLRLAADAVPDFGPGDARQIAAAVMRHPGARIAPPPIALPPITTGGVAADRARFATAVRDEVARRKLRTATLGYDDLLHRLADALGSGRAEAARARFRARYRVALVDEFQDTDPVQWRILEELFVAPGCSLVLIGDPKQAIYNFRGADVTAYLTAAERATTTATLGVNWRSDPELLDALDGLLRGATLGHPRIAYRKVEAALDPTRARLEGAPDPAAMRIRMLPGDARIVPLLRSGRPSKPGARRAIANDLAADLAGLLSAVPALVRRDRAGGELEREDLHPGHVAVLVSTHDEAELVHTALGRAGVPAVINGAGSVFAAPVASEWLALVEAVERPSSELRARTAARTSFVGWEDPQVAAASDDELARLQATLQQWAAVLERDGVAAMLESVTAATDLPARILGRHGGERHLTDLRHIGQLLHAEATRERMGVNALAGWLRQRIVRAGDDGSAAEERTRRLETDADAVQVITIHRAKGLEFPVVYAPYLWATGHRRQDAFPVCHDPDDPGRRVVDVGGPSGRGLVAHQLAAGREDSAEELRRTYVALTRARHQLVVWWAGSDDSGSSAMARLLARRPDGEVGEPLRRPVTDEEMERRIRDVAACAPESVSVSHVGRQAELRWTPPRRPDTPLAVSVFDRALDAAWRRSSYSAITAAAAHGDRAVVGSEPDDAGTTDESIAGGDAVTADAWPPASSDLPPEVVVSPMADLPGGPALGTLVHAVLERLDFAATDLRSAAAAAVEEAAAVIAPVDGVDRSILASAVATVVETPLGADVGDRRLRDFPRGDRLDELAFELPVAGGDLAVGTVEVADVAALLAETLAADDPLAAYPERLAEPSVASSLRGYLTGSIDVVLRARGPDGTPRYHVVDYKTNRLGRRDEPLATAAYAPSGLAAAMIGGHYPLQALLYSVALHRYLRWRQPGYDPAVHIGSCLYLFVRGMAGARTPREGSRPCGVFAWTPPPMLVPALSDLLDRGRP